MVSFERFKEFYQKTLEKSNEKWPMSRASAIKKSDRFFESIWAAAIFAFGLISRICILR